MSSTGASAGSFSIDHLHYLSLALAQARLSPPRPTNFCVGALLLSPSRASLPISSTATTAIPSTIPPAAQHDPDFDPRILALGYTLECEGNTHAEQCCFIKLFEKLQLQSPTLRTTSTASATPIEDLLGPRLPDDVILYTTMEPCNKRSPGNTPCVDRILALKRTDGSAAVSKVMVGVAEPDTFVGANDGKRKLVDAGIEVIQIGGLEEEILRVATAGHEKSKG